MAINSNSFRFGPYQLDGQTRVLRKFGRRIKLSGQPIEVLLLLVSKPGEVVSRDEIRSQLWPDGTYVDFETSLNTIIKKLRRKLNDDPQRPRYIGTVSGCGYRFVGALEPEGISSPDCAGDEQLGNSSGASETGGRYSEAESVSILATKNLEHIPSLTTGVGRLMITASIMIAITVGMILAKTAFAEKKAQAPAIAKASRVLIRPSVAVMKIENLSQGSDGDWLSSAISGMLATELEKEGIFRVVRDDEANRDASVHPAAGRGLQALRALRADLGVDYVVAGSYVMVGEGNDGNIRVDLRLKETISGETLSSVAVSGSQSKIGELVSDVGQQINAKLGSAAPPNGDVDWQSVRPSNQEAARLYAQGLTRLRAYDFRGAADALQRSVDVEPNFALGHALLAEAWSQLGDKNRALAAAESAMSSINSRPEDVRLAIEARYYEVKADWAGALGAYQHLLHDFPDDLDSGVNLAYAQLSAGDIKSSMETITRLRALDQKAKPDPRIDLIEAHAAATRGDFGQQLSLAVSAIRKAETLHEQLMVGRAKLVQARALQSLGRAGEAKEAVSEARKILAGSGDILVASTETRAINP